MVAVMDSVAIYRQGLLALLESAGIESIAVDTAAELELRAEVTCVAVVLRLERDWELLTELRARAERSVVALVQSFDPPTVERALLGGAVGVVDWRAGPCEVVTVVRQALRGGTILPPEIWRSMIGGAAESSSVSRTELSWLKDLAAGETVSRIAVKAGYSERELYRHLSRLYSRLRVASRTEAILWAQRAGLLAPSG